MIARGDMGVEIASEEVPVIQKMIIKKVYEAGKKVITATQMLDSMMKNPGQKQPMWQMRFMTAQVQLCFPVKQLQANIRWKLYRQWCVSQHGRNRILITASVSLVMTIRQAQILRMQSATRPVRQRMILMQVQY